jgi:hypothetical protein
LSSVAQRHHDAVQLQVSGLDFGPQLGQGRVLAYNQGNEPCLAVRQQPLPHRLGEDEDRKGQDRGGCALAKNMPPPSASPLCCLYTKFVKKSLKSIVDANLREHWPSRQVYE